MKKTFFKLLVFAILLKSGVARAQVYDFDVDYYNKCEISISENGKDEIKILRRVSANSPYTTVIALSDKVERILSYASADASPFLVKASAPIINIVGRGPRLALAVKGGAYFINHSGAVSFAPVDLTEATGVFISFSVGHVPSDILSRAGALVGANNDLGIALNTGYDRSFEYGAIVITRGSQSSLSGETDITKFKSVNSTQPTQVSFMRTEKWLDRPLSQIDLDRVTLDLNGGIYLPETSERFDMVYRFQNGVRVPTSHPINCDWLLKLGKNGEAAPSVPPEG